MRNGGLRFVKFVNEKEDLFDDIVSIASSCFVYGSFAIAYATSHSLCAE